MSNIAQGIAKAGFFFKGKVHRSVGLQFLDEDWKPLTDKDYEYIMLDGQEIRNKKTNEQGFVLEANLNSGGRIKLILPEEPETEVDQDIEWDDFSGAIEYPDNPGPLPALDLRNRSGGGQGPLQRGIPGRSIVEHLQSILSVLGYDLGASGQEEDGVDGLFEDKTEAAVKEFQESHKDWDGQQLKVDGLVGPKTSDALNRELVGIWYSKYETPMQLTPRRKVVAMTEDLIVEEGLST